MRGDPPAHDRARAGIDDEADVGDPGPGRHVSQVSDPQLVRRLGSELSAHLVPADIVAGALGGPPDIPSPVDPVVLLPQLPHHRCHHRVSFGTIRGLAGLRDVVGARIHL